MELSRHEMFPGKLSDGKMPATNCPDGRISGGISNGSCLREMFEGKRPGRNVRIGMQDYKLSLRMAVMILTHCLTRRQTDRQTEDYKSSLRMAVMILTHCLTRRQTDRQTDRQTEDYKSSLRMAVIILTHCLTRRQTDRQTDRQRITSHSYVWRLSF